ncbi:MAG: hypothetical protein JW985_02480, partial [Alphaproteobacteria bacterium]|nr:hypothetical protein [Alphaproteobacteria bacterium]
SAFDSNNTIKGVTNPTTLADIKYGCEAVVNNDAYCKYSVATFQSATGILDFLSGSLFDVLFTAADDKTATNPDAVGAVATLNSKLSLSYNQSSLDNMKKQCQAIATGCVKSMCGTDYANCYRNRTDVYSTLTNTGDNSFDKSMNKVGGVLDHTVILGLCLNTVKNNPVCEEHIKAEAARRTAGTGTADSWNAGANGTNTRDGWLGAGTFGATATGDTIQDVDADGNLLCTTGASNAGDSGRCDDSSGRYIYPRMVSESAYNIAQTERSVFNDLVYDLEVEAQAKYNAKLTKQQNMCMSNNEGGIIGSRENGSTFMWVKLKNSKVPSNYAMNGLKNNQFVASNDIYGSFCRVRVTLQSDDKYIQDAINAGKDWSTAYFATGDTFTCGSWIPNSELEAISKKFASSQTDTNSNGDLKKGQKWAVAGTTILGAIGGGVATNYLQNKTGLGGLLKTDNQKTNANVDNNNLNIQKCRDEVSAKRQKVTSDEDEKISKILAKLDKALADLVGTEATTNPEIEKLQSELTDAQKHKVNALKEMDTLYSNCGSIKEKATKDWGDGTGKTVVNAAGAVVGGTVLGIGTAQVMKSVNRSNFDAEQQAWMNDVGNHIRCYIGSDEVGMYSDIISTEME